MIEIAYLEPYDRVWDNIQWEMELSASDFASRVEYLGGSYGTIVVGVRQYILRYSSQDMIIMGTYDPESEQMFLLWSSGEIQEINLKDMDKALSNFNIESLFFTLLQTGTPVGKPLLERICEGHIS